MPGKVPILAFHKVDSKFEFGLTRTTPRQFERFLGFLHREGFHSVSLEQIYNRKDLPEKAVCITFDDSYASVFEYAYPVMKKFGFTGTIFVITDFIGRKNTWDVNLGWIQFQHLNINHLKILQNQGWEIGSHTVSHPDLSRVDRDRTRIELTDSKQKLDSLLNQETRFLAFPFGRYRRETVETMRECGYAAGCGFWHRTQGDESRFVFERSACYLMDGITQIRAKLGNHFLTPVETLKLKTINFFSHGTSLIKTPG